MTFTKKSRRSNDPKKESRYWMNESSKGDKIREVESATDERVGSNRRRRSPTSIRGSILKRRFNNQILVFTSIMG